MDKTEKRDAVDRSIEGSNGHKRANGGASPIAGVKELTKDQILVAVAVLIILFSAMFDWNIYSWLMLLGMIVSLFAWYLKK